MFKIRENNHNFWFVTLILNAEKNITNHTSKRFHIRQYDQQNRKFNR